MKLFPSIAAAAVVGSTMLVASPKTEAMCFGSLGCQQNNYTIQRNNNGYTMQDSYGNSTTYTRTNNGYNYRSPNSQGTIRFSNGW